MRGQQQFKSQIQWPQGLRLNKENIRVFFLIVTAVQAPVQQKLGITCTIVLGQHLMCVYMSPVSPVFDNVELVKLPFLS